VREVRRERGNSLAIGYERTHGIVRVRIPHRCRQDDRSAFRHVLRGCERELKRAFQTRAKGSLELRDIVGHLNVVQPFKRRVDDQDVEAAQLASDTLGEPFMLLYGRKVAFKKSRTASGVPDPGAGFSNALHPVAVDEPEVRAFARKRNGDRAAEPRIGIGHERGEAFEPVASAIGVFAMIYHSL
jgi:hypothetical protein